MNSVILNMLKKYVCSTESDTKNALKEIIQEIALLGLWRSKFFEHAAFYGGTALRILYGLDRFSEDLDFSLLKPDPQFSLQPYEKALKTELNSFGFDVSVRTKVKSKDSAIVSAFLKANTLEHLIQIGIRSNTHHLNAIKIKIEVDTDPPPQFETAAHFIVQPLQFSVRVYKEPYLFAGKLHAVLCRSWATRVKGRDWYDLAWFVSRNTPVDVAHLEVRMRQSGHYNQTKALTLATLQDLLRHKIETLDIEAAKRDIIPFLKDTRRVDIWSHDFFKAVCAQITC